MFKFVALSALSAAALAAPSADPQVVVGGVPQVAALPAGILAPNCKIEYEEIEVQNCVPKPNRVCDTKELKNEGIEYERVCKDVVSKHCAGGHAAPYTHLLAKREAEADPQFPYVAAPLAAAVHTAPTVTTVTHPCQEVKTTHCVDSPKKVEGTVPVERCHVERVVECEMITQKVPKTVCEEVESKIVTPGLVTYAGLPHPLLHK